MIIMKRVGEKRVHSFLSHLSLFYYHYQIEIGWGIIKKGITVPKRENCTRLAETHITRAFQRYLFSLTRKGRNLSKLVACFKFHT